MTDFEIHTFDEIPIGYTKNFSVKIDEEITDRKIIEKIILCEVQNKIYNNLEQVFINLLTNSGYPGVKIEKKIDFEKLYNQKLS